MANSKRWSKVFIDKREWRDHEHKATKKYEIYLDLDWVKSWKPELEEMNKNKLLCDRQDLGN